MLACAAVAAALTAGLGPLHERAWSEVPVGRLPPGREARVQPWLDALEKAGLPVASASIGGEEVRLEAGEGGTTCALRLARPGAHPEAPRTPSFAVAAEPRPGCAAMAARAATLLEPLDDGSFFLTAPGERFPVAAHAPGPRPEKLVRWVLELLAWTALLLGAAVLVGSVAPFSRATALMAALCALSVALRLLLPAAGPIHANGHGIRELLSYMPAAAGPGSPGLDGGYGYAGALLFRMLATISGSTGTDLLALGGALAGLAPPLCAAAARALGAGPLGAWLAAALYAVLPLLVRVAPTESTLLPAALLALGSAVAAHRGLSRPALRLPELVLSGCLAVLALQCHVVTVFWLPVLLMAPFLAPGGRRAAAAALVAAVLVLGLPHLLFVLETFGGGIDRPVEPVSRLLEQLGRPAVAALNPFLLPLALLPLALLLPAQLLCRRASRVRAAFVLLSLACVTLPSAAVSQTLSDVLRYNAPLALLLVVLAPAGLERCAATAGGVVRVRAALLAGLLVLTWLPTIPLMWAPDPETEVVRVVERAGEGGLLDAGLVAARPRKSEGPRTKTGASSYGPGIPAWALPGGAPRIEVPRTAPVLVGTGCVQRASELDPYPPPLDSGCARSVGPEPVALSAIPHLPEGYAGLELWFHPRRPGSPPPGIYRPAP